MKHIIAPFGEPIDQRPPVPTLEELIAAREEKKAVKDERRAVRREEEATKAREEKQRRKEKLAARGKAPSQQTTAETPQE